MRKTACRRFLAVEGVLYLLFISRDLLRLGGTVWLKFAAIVLVAAAGVGFAGPARADRLTAAALCATLAADLFLLVLDAAYPLGLTLFLLVQALYTLRLAAEFRARRSRLLSRALPALAAALFFTQYGTTAALAAAYIVWFAGNLIDSIRCAARRPDGQRICFAFGLALFFCCDLCVGVHNLPAALPPAWLSGFASVAMWVFYLPGQILILASTEALKGLRK